jgi:uncharacterized membrane protein YqhA
MRFVMLFASLGAMAGAILMFFVGGEKLVHTVTMIVMPDPVVTRDVTISVMGATDAFLFGIVLVIFAYGVMFGFVLKPPPEVQHRLPSWMRMTGIHELKHTLVEVILVYMIVDFATDLAATEDAPTWSALVKPMAIVMIAAALRLFGGMQSGDQPSAQAGPVAET